MESAKKRSSDRAVLLILAVYFLPAILLTFLSAVEVSSSPSRVVFAAGLLIASLGSAVLLLLFQKRQVRTIETVSIKEIAAPLSSEESEAERFLKKELEAVKAEWFEKKQENELLLQRLERAEGELSQTQSQTQDQMRKKELLLSEYTKTVEELYRKMEEKQAEITKLEGSVSELSYDLDTLLKLSKTEERSTPEQKIEVVSLIRSEKDAEQLMRRCMNTLQKFTSNFFAHPGEHSALDHRRLYDSFRSENAAVVFLYSLKEGTMLFISDSAKAHLGWSADHFAHDFFDLVVEGLPEWRESIASLPMRSEAKLHLLIHTNEGQDLLMQCRLAMIPTGVFKHQAVGILYRIS